MNPLLFLRVGYMERYDGPGVITGGGAYVKKRGVGGEVYNFKPSRGKCYGYAMSRHHAGIRLKMLDSSKTWAVGDELAGVDVVFMAARPGVGQVVVGWYRNATVFHRQYRVRRGRIPGMDESLRQYMCVVEKNDATLLPEEMRTFPVPVATQGFKGFPGQSNVWYPGYHEDLQSVRDFIRRFRRYMAGANGTSLPPDEQETPVTSNKKARRVDAAHNAAVEKAAVDAAWTHWEKRGYKVTCKQADNVGWDLEVRKGAHFLRVEVKGQSGDSVNFGLTPNEFAKLQLYSSSYRVCLVLTALDKPQLFDLSPTKTGDGWHLTSKEGEGMRVSLTERVAAIGIEVAA